MSPGQTRMGEKSGTVTPAEFRAACGLFPTGVTVVTRRTRDGRATGMTVSSFTSVSLHPPLILVCINKLARMIVDSHPGDFAVNILSERQQELAVRFSALPDHLRFEGIAWKEGWGGVPLLEGAVASLVCRTYDVVEAGDHFVLVGLVEHIEQREGRALVWCESRYHCLPTPPLET